MKIAFDMLRVVDGAVHVAVDAAAVAPPVPEVSFSFNFLSLRYIPLLFVSVA